MELFKNIRLKIGKAILSKKVSQNKEKSSLFKYSARSKTLELYGMLQDLMNLHAYQSFIKKCMRRNIDVKILGYFPGKNLPDQYTAIRYLTCIRKR